MRTTSLMVATLLLAACSSHRLPHDSHARLNPQMVLPESDEIGADIRAEIDDAVEKHLLTIGRYPTRTAYDAEVRSLHRVPNRTVPTYLARVYIPWDVSSTEMDFLISRRGDEWVVRKAST